MPVPIKLTSKQREILLEDLRLSFSRAEKGDYHSLCAVVADMSQLGLKRYESFTLGMLRALRNYVGRIYFNRRLTVSLQDMAHRAEVGDHELPIKPTVQKMLLKLESHDDSRELICELRFFCQTAELTTEELRIGMGTLAEYGDLGVTMHFHAPHSNRRRWGCLTCGSPYCYQVSSSTDYPIAEAYTKGGLEAVWKVLDKAWIDLVHRRVPRSPLSKQDLWVRFYMHQSEVVRILTTDGPFIGHFQSIKTDDRGTIKDVVLRQEEWGPFGNHYPEIELRACTIFEILPARLEYEHVFGMPIFYA